MHCIFFILFAAISLACAEAPVNNTASSIEDELFQVLSSKNPAYFEQWLKQNNCANRVFRMPFPSDSSLLKIDVTPLFLACFFKFNTTLLDALIKAGATIHTQFVYGLHAEKLDIIQVMKLQLKTTEKIQAILQACQSKKQSKLLEESVDLYIELMEAIEINDITRVKAAINKGLDLNYVPHEKTRFDKRAPLEHAWFIALLRGTGTEVIGILLDAGANPKAAMGEWPANFWPSALDSQINYLKTTISFLENYGSALHAPSQPQDATISQQLKAAIRTRDVEKIKHLLLEASPNAMLARSELDIPGHPGVATPLYIACQLGLDSDFLSQLINNGADVRTIFPFGFNQEPLNVIQILKKQLASLKQLKDALLNKRTSNHHRPVKDRSYLRTLYSELLFAIDAHDLAGVKTAINNGADVNFVPNNLPNAIRLIEHAFLKALVFALDTTVVTALLEAGGELQGKISLADKYALDARIEYFEQTISFLENLKIT